MNEQYPECILPGVTHFTRIDIESLTNEISAVMVRRHDDTIENTFDPNGLLYPETFEETEIQRLSMNLFGGEFNKNHLKYRPSREYWELWNGEAAPKAEDIEFTIYPDPFCAVHFEINNLNNYVVPYDYPLTGELKKKYDQFMKQVDPYFKLPNTTHTELSATINTIHSPTTSNYWHVELNITDFYKEDIKTGSKPAYILALKKEIIKNQISMLGRPNLHVSEVPSKFYKK